MAVLTMELHGEFLRPLRKTLLHVLRLLYTSVQSTRAVRFSPIRNTTLSRPSFTAFSPTTKTWTQTAEPRIRTSESSLSGTKIRFALWASPTMTFTSSKTSGL